MSDASTTPDIEEEISKEPIVQVVVEDGTCVVGANSYVDLEFASYYLANRNKTDWLELTDDEKLASLVSATVYVDNKFNWKGRRKFEKQELCFPRVEIKDDDGFVVAGIPERLKKAVCEAAYLGWETELYETVDTNGNIKRKKTRQKVDVLEDEQETEYFENTKKEADYLSSYDILNSLLKGLYETNEKNGKVNSRARWRY